MHIPPGYANLQFVMRNPATGQEAMTAIGLAIAAADPPALLAAAEGVWVETWSTVVNEVWEGEVMRLVVGTSNPAAPLTFERSPWEGGNNTGAPCPPNVAVLVKKLTDQGGRAGRGRMFIPSPAEAGVDSSGLFSTTEHAYLQGEADDFLEGLENLDGVTSVVLFHSEPGDDPAIVNQLVVQRMVATQRRRLRG